MPVRTRTTPQGNPLQPMPGTRRTSQSRARKLRIFGKRLRQSMHRQSALLEVVITALVLVFLSVLLYRAAGSLEEALAAVAWNAPGSISWTR